MTDLDFLISDKGMVLLKGLIGQEFISMKHEKFWMDTSVFGRAVVITSNGNYQINNDVEWYDDYFGGPDAIPHLDFRRLKKGENPLRYAKGDRLSIETIGEKIVDIHVIRDHADVLDGDTHRQYMDTSEGIVIITEKTQYGFFKDSIHFDETLFIWEGDDVMERLQDLQPHWNIFGYPYNAKVERFLLSLKTGVEQKLGEVEEHGVAGKEEANN